jgi:hypothetical protein
MRRVVPASKRSTAASLRRRSQAFARAAVVLEHWRLQTDNCLAASEALAEGNELWHDAYLLTSRDTLLMAVGRAAMAATFRSAGEITTGAETRAVRAVVRAHILGTTISKRTVAQILQLGGWYAEVGMSVLGRAR